MKPKLITMLVLCTLGASTLTASAALAAPLAQADDPSPPDQAVKLIFIHHSCGENWLADGYGNLGRTLGQNNYFVSDTNYGWGPDSIGDRTDIPDWIEWFRSSSTSTYMEALFNESDQNSDYTRSLANPGGENEIIMFKSCYPNSDLYGDPDDPPGTYADLTVSGAKYVYNELLEYFQTRPDKLFIVITAPPISHPDEAENARAFNNWLVYDWLDENDYPYNNVTVFDFYNVLTHPDAHHWYHNGQIEHVTTGRDTSYYPTDDDHPSAAGSQKATNEFVSLLNVYYHRWQAGSAQLPVAALPEQPAVSQEEAEAYASRDLDDFESGNPQGTNGWEAFWDEATPSTMVCAPDSGDSYSGDYALKIDFDIQPNAWGTCALFYDEIQDWSASEGLTFYLRASDAELIFNFDLYVAGDNEQETYLTVLETPADSVDGWISITIYWSDFERAAWEEDAGAALARQDQIQGLAFGFSTDEDETYTGTLYIDELSLLGTESEGEEEETEAEGGGGFLPCMSALLLPLLAAAAWIYKSTRRI